MILYRFALKALSGSAKHRASWPELTHSLTASMVAAEMVIVSLSLILDGFMQCKYRASHVLVDLGWVDLDLGSPPAGGPLL